MPQTKIATCSFCGTRAALVLTGQTSHELACSSCGAPLHDLKKLKSGAVDAGLHRAPRKGRKATRHRDTHAAQPGLWDVTLAKPKKRRKPKKRKSLLSEAFDLLEDIFD